MKMRMRVCPHLPLKICRLWQWADHGPKDIKSWSCEPANIILFRESVYEDVIKGKILRWGDYPRFSAGGQGNLHAITHIFVRVEERQIRHTEKSGTEGCGDAGLRLEGCSIRNAGSHQTLGEARDRSSPTAFRGSVPCWHLNVHPVILMSDFWSPEQWQNLLLLLLSQFMAICHRSHGN